MAAAARAVGNDRGNNGGAAVKRAAVSVMHCDATSLITKLVIQPFTIESRYDRRNNVLMHIHIYPVYAKYI